LSTGFIGFPQVFSDIYRFCSVLGTFTSKNPNKTANFKEDTFAAIAVSCLCLSSPPTALLSLLRPIENNLKKLAHFSPPEKRPASHR
jgi:hypothetical protein